MLKKEHRANNILILEKLDSPVSLWKGGFPMHYRLIHQWMSDGGEVVGEDVSYWTQGEGEQMLKEGLFDYVDFFGA